MHFIFNKVTKTIINIALDYRFCQNFKCRICHKNKLLQIYETNTINISFLTYKKSNLFGYFIIHIGVVSAGETFV